MTRSGYYVGRQLIQQDNFEITVDQRKFAIERLSPILISKDRKKERDEFLGASETTQLRAVLGALGWLARESYYPLAGDVALLMTCVPTPRVRDMVWASEIVDIIKKEPPVIIRILQINLKELCWFSVSDAPLWEPQGRRHPSRFHRWLHYSSTSRWTASSRERSHREISQAPARGQLHHRR